MVAIYIILNMIICGNCRGEHEGVEEVRKCSGLATAHKESKAPKTPKAKNARPSQPAKNKYLCGDFSHSHTTKKDALECAKRGGRPKNVKETVYVTNRGDRFHNNKNCPALNQNLHHTLHAVLWLHIKYEHYTACKKCIF